MTHPDIGSWRLRHWRYSLTVKSSRMAALNENPERAPLAAMAQMTEEQLKVWHEIRDWQLEDQEAVGIVVQAIEGEIRN